MNSLFFFQAEDGIRDYKVTGVQTCALPISCVLPARDTTNEGSTQGIGEQATSEGPREGPVAVVASYSTRERGEVRPKRPTGGKATSGRAFQRVRYTRETLSSLIVSPPPHWTVS